MTFWRSKPLSRVTFLELRVENFMSFEDATILFRSSGLTHVLGEVVGGTHDSNGAGKSALFEALSWVLFGQTIRDISVAQVVRSGTEAARVTLNFLVGDIQYRLVRVRGRGAGVSLFLVAEDGSLKDISGSSLQESNSKISALLGFTFDMFVNSVFYGQGLPYRFIQATDSEKKALVEDMLSLGWIQSARGRAVEASKYYEGVQTEIDRQIFENEVGKQACENLIFEYEAQHKSLRDKILEAERAQEAERVSRHTALLKDISLLKKAIQATTEARRVAKDGYDKAEAEHISLTQGLSSLATEKALVEQQASSLGKEISNIQKTDICPTCTQPVPLDVRRSLLGNKGTTHKLLVRRGKSLALDYQSKTMKVNGLAMRVSELKVVLEGLNQTLFEQRHSLESMKKDLVGLGPVQGDVSPLREQLDILTSRLSKERGDRQSLIEIISEQASLKAAVGHIQKMVAFWVVGFSNRGLKSFVLDAIIPFLNERAAEYSQRLTDGLIQINFTIESAYDRFVVKVGDISSMVEYSQFSGGERRRVDVIVLLALCDLISSRSGVDVNIQIFDEVAENLDRAGIERLMGLLSDISQRKGVYVISHNSEFEQYFSRSLVVSKGQSGISSAQEVLK